MVLADLDDANERLTATVGSGDAGSAGPAHSPTIAGVRRSNGRR